MKKPVIIITPQYNDSGNRIDAPLRYAEYFGHAGGLCLVSPLINNENDIDQLAELCNGAVFSGGDDVDPELYGEEKDPLCRLVTRDRDDFEIAFLHACIKHRKPVIGICRGIQLMNVALGGTLYQHLDGHGNGIIHNVNIKPGTLLHKIIGQDTIKTNSYHHQMVKKPAPGLVVSATVEGGYCEAIELPDYPFFLGVQWHPEAAAGEECDVWSNKIIEAFVNECKKNMR
ncbi:MAG: gamma-glutamyl-gamma-aminobutyrate hydrolase family protein [Eubacteriales bacterium]|jgi:putative glutamine amidotransferase